MAQIVSFEEVKKEGRKLGEQMMSSDRKNQAEFAQFLSELQDLQPDGTDFEYLGRMLMLPDEQFAILAPHFLESLSNTYNITEHKILLARILTTQGITLQDLYDQEQELHSLIENEMGSRLSPQKIAFLKEIASLAYNTLADVDGLTKTTVQVQLEYCNPDAKMPHYAHVNDSGMDVYTIEEITLAPGETKLVPLGIKVGLPKGYELQVRPKSGRSLKSKLRIANAPGTIDEGYRDEICIIVENTDQFIKHADLDEKGNLTSIEFGSNIVIGKGEKIAQLVLAMVPKVAWEETNAIVGGSQNRGGGFGSTGDK